MNLYMCKGSASKAYLSHEDKRNLWATNVTGLEQPEVALLHKLPIPSQQTVEP